MRDREREKEEKEGERKGEIEKRGDEEGGGARQRGEGGEGREKGGGREEERGGRGWKEEESKQRMSLRNYRAALSLNEFLSHFLLSPGCCYSGRLSKMNHLRSRKGTLSPQGHAPSGSSIPL